jgi:hypothetical protein
MARIETRQPASEEEAAAIAAAVERFAADTAPAPAAPAVEMDPWLRAALVEGVNAREIFGPGQLGDPGQ